MSCPRRPRTFVLFVLVRVTVLIPIYNSIVYPLAIVCPRIISLIYHRSLRLTRFLFYPIAAPFILFRYNSIIIYSLFHQARRDSDLPDLPSIVSFLDSCVRGKPNKYCLLLLIFSYCCHCFYISTATHRHSSSLIVMHSGDFTNHNGKN